MKAASHVGAAFIVFVILFVVLPTALLDRVWRSDYSLRHVDFVHPRSPFPSPHHRGMGVRSRVNRSSLVPPAIDPRHVLFFSTKTDAVRLQAAPHNA
jgi:hypothetical protein